MRSMSSIERSARGGSWMGSWLAVGGLGLVFRTQVVRCIFVCRPDDDQAISWVFLAFKLEYFEWVTLL